MKGRRPTKVYELTEKGKQLSIRIHTRIASLISSYITQDLTICFHCGCKIHDGGYPEILEGEEKKFCCIHCAEAFKQESVMQSS
jgi:hypothetical protein